MAGSPVNLGFGGNVKSDDLLFLAARIIFYVLALIVLWSTFAPDNLRLLSETDRKFWAMAGLALYAIILLEDHRRKHEK